MFYTYIPGSCTYMIIYICIYMYASAAKSLQLCPTLCDPIDGSPPGSSIHGIFQARVLEWGTIAFSAIRTRGDYLGGLMQSVTTTEKGPVSFGDEAG